jgi:hypothetical protein
MNYYTYTILECGDPEIIASGSTFVKDSKSKLLEITKNKSHFLTYATSMNDEIIELSLKHSGETFYAECFWEYEFQDRVKYFFEYKNGIRKDVVCKPDYIFFFKSEKIPNKEVYLAFKEHVREYLRRLDIVNKDADGYFIDKLSGHEDQYGYESTITITYENDYYRWTATRSDLSNIEVRVEKLQPKIYRPPKFGDKEEEYYDLPF